MNTSAWVRIVGFVGIGGICVATSGTHGVFDDPRWLQVQRQEYGMDIEWDMAKKSLLGTGERCFRSRACLTCQGTEQENTESVQNELQVRPCKGRY